jgi:hypothetical protein
MRWPGTLLALGLASSVVGAAAATVAASGSLKSLIEQARHLQLRVSELRLELARQVHDTERLSALREQARLRQAEVAELGPKFVDAKPNARSHSPEQVAYYNQLQSQLAGADAALTEATAAIGPLERAVAARQLLLDTGMREDREEAASLEDRLGALGIPLSGTQAKDSRAAAKARPAGVVRRELAREREAADELRARLAYDDAVTDTSKESESGALKGQLTQHESRIQALQRELASLVAARARGAADARRAAGIADPTVLRPVRLALAEHQVLVLEQELATLEDPSRRGAIEQERQRLLEWVSELSGVGPSVTP